MSVAAVAMRLVDADFQRSSALHKRLFEHVRHPGGLFYVVVCRVALGHFCRTQEGERMGPRTMDKPTSSVFPSLTNTRELAAVPGVTPPVHYHALIAETGRTIARFREFISFHSEYVYPEYVLAYQRFKGKTGPVA